MANIPTIPGSAQVQDQSIGTKVNVQPRLQALGQFRQTVGKADAALNEGMAGIEDYELRKRKAEEAATFNETSIKLMKATGDFRHTLKTQKDDEILTNWTNASSQLKEQITSEPSFAKMSPRAQAKLKMHLDSWQGQSSAEFQVAADKLGSQRRRATAIAASAEFLKTGDPVMMKNATSALDTAVKVGDMTPEQAEKTKSQFPAVLQENQVRNLIINNPVAARDGVTGGKYPSIPETTRVTLEKEANQAINQRQIGKYKEIRTHQSEGKIYTRKELNDMADVEDISGGSIDTILKAQKGDISEEDNGVAASKVHDAILDIPRNATKDQRLDAVVKIHGSKDYQSLTEQQKKDFDSALKPDKDGTNPIHRTQLQMMKETFEDRDKASRMTPGDYRSKFGHTSKQPDTETERMRYAKAQQQYNDWAQTKEGASAGPEAAAAERERLGFGAYKSAMDVKAAVKANRISRDLAKDILQNQFGISAK